MGRVPPCGGITLLLGLLIASAASCSAATCASVEDMEALSDLLADCRLAQLACHGTVAQLEAAMAGSPSCPPLDGDAPSARVRACKLLTAIASPLPPPAACLPFF